MEVRAHRVRVEALRASCVESRHEVHVATLGLPSLTGCEAQIGALPRTNMRSTAKPFQLLPLVARGEADRLGLEAADLAVMCASHDGTPAHAARVGRILERLDAKPDDLRLGLHRPYFLDGIRANETEHARLYGPLHHNCSGNHAALLALAKTFDVDPARYLEPQLESNQLIEGAIRALAGEEPVVQEDNCGAPCFELPLSRIAAVYRALAAPSGVRDLPPRRRALLEAIAPLDAIENALARITEALIAHPQWVSAESSAARAVAQRVTSGLVVKHGGEGMLCAAHPQSGAALAFKVRDGNGRATIPSLVFAARRFGWLSEDDVEALNTHPELLLHGHRGHPIGRLRGVAPE